MTRRKVIQAMRAASPQHALAGHDAGAVDGAVEAAEGLPGEIDGRLDLAFVGHIGRHETRAAAQFGGDTSARFRIHVAEHDVGAGFRQQAGRAGAQAGCAAGDQEGAAFDSHR